MRLLPTKQIATYIQAGAKSNEGDGVARIQCVGACQPVKRKGNAGARNVAGLAQRANHALVRHAQTLDRLAQDSFVSLMEYKMIDVYNRNARINRKLMDRVADGVDAELEHAAAIHEQHARAICGSLKRRGAD